MTRAYLLLAGLVFVVSAAPAQTLEPLTAWPDTVRSCVPCTNPVAVRGAVHVMPVDAFLHLADGPGSSDFGRPLSVRLEHNTGVSPRLRGALQGAGVGLFLGALVGGFVGSRSEKCSGEGPCGLGLIVGAIGGGAIGAVLGALIGAAVANDPESAEPAPAA